MDSQVRQTNHSKYPSETKEITPRQTYSRKELEALRFVNICNQNLRWKSVYQTLDPVIAKGYEGLRAPDHQHAKRKQKKKKTANLKETPKMKLNVASESEKDNVTKKIDCADACNTENFYSRNATEALRFINTEEQERKWNDVYNELGPDIVDELDGLLVSTDRSQQSTWTKKIKGEVLSANDSANDEDVKNFKKPFDDYDDINNVDSSSGDEYASIQRPAFYVEGEPDFDSGPPEDGLEYLRRVRWEAAQIPKVKVVKPSSILASEQTHYMPIIPDIPTYPTNLLPSKDWEESFLANFSELRQKITKLGSSSGESQTSNKQVENIQQLKKNPPTLSTVLKMDAVNRTSLLKSYIASVENGSNISRDDCLWLFSLCAAVDTPLHADTCASLRSLLRKCCSLLALKSYCDDDVAMLSIIVTIAGKFFGQSENIAVKK